MKKRRPPEGQASLFEVLERRRATPEAGRVTVAPTASVRTTRQWRMPQLDGRTVAEIRVRWLKRLTPAQIARVEAELSTLPKVLAKLGFGAVQVEHAFVRRRRT